MIVSKDREHLRLHPAVILLAYQPSLHFVQFTLAVAESQVHALHSYGQATNTSHFRHISEKYKMC